MLVINPISYTTIGVVGSAPRRHCLLQTLVLFLHSVCYGGAQLREKNVQYNDMVQLWLGADRRETRILAFIEVCDEEAE